MAMSLQKELEAAAHALSAVRCERGVSASSPLTFSLPQPLSIHCSPGILLSTLRCVSLLPQASLQNTVMDTAGGMFPWWFQFPSSRWWRLTITFNKHTHTESNQVMWIMLQILSNSVMHQHVFPDNFLILFICIFLLLCVCSYVGACACRGVHVEHRGQISGVHSLLSHGCLGSKSGCQTSRKSLYCWAILLPLFTHFVVV